VELRTDGQIDVYVDVSSLFAADSSGVTLRSIARVDGMWAACGEVDTGGGQLDGFVATFLEDGSTCWSEQISGEQFEDDVCRTMTGLADDDHLVAAGMADYAAGSSEKGWLKIWSFAGGGGTDGTQIVDGDPNNNTTDPDPNQCVSGTYYSAACDQCIDPTCPYICERDFGDHDRICYQDVGDAVTCESVLDLRSTCPG
jgi:hypothetical protein